MTVICPICKQHVWIPEGEKLALCGDDVHFTESQVREMLYEQRERTNLLFLASNGTLKCAEQKQNS